jgi:DNA integrity scanning protein DisA with diadenylate cyclase activity
MEIIWTDRVRNEEVLHRNQEEVEYAAYNKRSTVNCVCHILHRNCLVKHIIEEKIERRFEVTGRQGRRRKRLLDDLKER